MASLCILGSLGQASFDYTAKQMSCRTFQDSVSCLKEKTATGFRIRVEAREGALLKHFLTFHARTSTNQYAQPRYNLHSSTSSLMSPALSQMALSPTNQSFCSPVITAAIRF